MEIFFMGCSQYFVLFIAASLDPQVLARCLVYGGTHSEVCWMYVWMSGWLDRWMDEWIYGWIKRWMDGRMDE